MSLSFIKEQFEKEGYTLLSEEYINSKTKLDYKCPNKHKHSITWHNWQKGYRCYLCNGNIKLTFGQIKESFEQESYTLLSEEYIDSKKQKLEYKCSKGHIHGVSWNSWQQGSRCPTCISTKPTLEQIKESFDSCGYTLLSKEYFNNKTKLDYICSKGHKHNINWHNWIKGARCPVCRNIKLSIKYSGAGSSNWLGGISYEPYCPIWKDKEYKEDIKTRDGYKCLNPYCDSKNPNDLVIHHIDYNKKNCGPKNLITVCRSCNNKANVDRDWHKTWYQAIIKNRYGGVTCL
jgi:hypothetical protein